jgi:hypothetical protein
VKKLKTGSAIVTLLPIKVNSSVAISKTAG